MQLIITFCIGFLIAYYLPLRKIGYFLSRIHIWFVVYFYLIPQRWYMEWYIKKRGWYNPVLKSKNSDYPEDWTSPEIWSHADDKNPPYNELGYCLYAAYCKASGKKL